MRFESLKDRQREERGGWPENLGLRVHRALSWLHRAEQLDHAGDTDGQFIFLWIAFNAAYATEIDEKYRDSEQQTFRAFLAKLDGLDAGRQRFEHLVWTGERRDFRRLTECQAACGNAGTLTCRPVRRGAGTAQRAGRRASGCCSTTNSCSPSSGGRRVGCRRRRTGRRVSTPRIGRRTWHSGSATQ